MNILPRILRFAFHHLYHDLAWTYDGVAAFVSLGRWIDWVRSVLPLVKPGRVLELGPGPGHLQVALRKAGYATIGLDESRQMLVQAAQRLRRSGLPAGLVRGTSQQLPFYRAFQNVVATFPTEYILDPRTLEGIWRALDQDGRLVVLMNAWIGGRSLTETAARWLFRVTHQGVLISDAAWERLMAPFQQAGFRVQGLTLEVRKTLLQFIIAEKHDSVVK